MTESRDFIRGNGRGVILRSGRDQEAPPPAPALIPIKMITSLGKLGGPGRKRVHLMSDECKH